MLFSQWTKILDMLEELLERLDIPFLRLDGSTPINERQDLIDRCAFVHISELSWS